jgi:hypothetical protein
MASRFVRSSKYRKLPATAGRKLLMLAQDMSLVDLQGRYKKLLSEGLYLLSI